MISVIGRQDGGLAGKIRPYAVRVLLICIVLTAQVFPNDRSVSGQTSKHHPIAFRDIAAGDRAGISYRRTPSPRLSLFEEIAGRPFFLSPRDFFASPIKSRGAPGVVLFDYNNDRCLDIFVTNGPGTGNSLYKNLLCETGILRFADVASAAGVAAADQDNQGACAGDIDNDGDQDLYVLGNHGSRLFENQGDGTFVDITEESGTGNADNTGTTCSMGDVNGDGLLDIVVANSYNNWDHKQVYAFNPFPFTERNELYLNRGNNRFAAAGESSGFTTLAGLPQGAAMLTWSVAMVDLDLDGDADIVTADDQTVLAPAQNGGEDVGFVRFAQNDGTGHFRDVTFDVNLNRYGAWMGLSFGDLNSDGRLDIFASNMGTYAAELVGPPFASADWSSRWFLGQADGTFADPGVGALGATPFGWGTSILDFDNDADQDIVMYGGFDLTQFVDASNTGMLAENLRGSANFVRNRSAFDTSVGLPRIWHGSAIGDLNNDGFDDIVSVSGFDVPPETPLISYPPLGSSFDVDARFVPVFFPTEVPGQLTFSGFRFVNGTLAVKINSANNGNDWIQVATRGTRGVVPRGRVNRDGIGAVVKVTPLHSKSVLRPVVAGSSHASQDTLIGTFGLGTAPHATVEVLWPGGGRNRLYNVKKGDRLLFPEIPCSFDSGLNRSEYQECVRQSLSELRRERILSADEVGRFFSSAMRAFNER